MRWLTMTLVLAAFLAGESPARAGDEVPPSLAPFSYLIGGWKGVGVHTKDRLKGWEERHEWAWAFQKGVPVGLTWTLTGDKTVAKGKLTFDPAASVYHLEGTDPTGQPVAFAGSMDAEGKLLALDKVGSSPGGKERLTIRLLADNGVRYALWLDRQEPGAPRNSRAIEVGLTKEGEAFAAGGEAADLPKCIITGGAATMSVSFQGKSYPLCCSGCRDEFRENPEKYVQKAILSSKTADPAQVKPASSPALRKDDGAFDGLVSEPEPRSPKASARPTPKSTTATEPKKATPPAPGPDPAAKAATLVRSAQSLEKLGKTDAALDYYKEVVAKYPGTPQAKTAGDRIKALARP